MRPMIATLPLALLAMATPARAQPPALDPIPRTVLMTAFAPEWDALIKSVARPVEHRINGRTLVTGSMAGKPVLLMQSGVSMVNAAMNTQIVLDRFKVKRIVFSGIAGGIDPGLSIGDVIVADRWAQYLEVSFARQTATGWVTPEPVDAGAPANFGMMFPRGVRVGNAAEPARRHYDLAVDPALLDLARKVALGTTLRRCVAAATGGAVAAATGSTVAAATGSTVAAATGNYAAAATGENACLAHTPRIVVGGVGVSAGVFADNAEFRDYLARAWRARVLDMESAAVMQVAYANGVPAIVFRSLSDLAGGDAGGNQMTTFMALASVNSADVVRAFLTALPD